MKWIKLILLGLGFFYQIARPEPAVTAPAGLENVEKDTRITRGGGHFKPLSDPLSTPANIRAFHGVKSNEGVFAAYIASISRMDFPAPVRGEVILLFRMMVIGFW